MAGQVHRTTHGPVALLEIDNPPVNATSQAIRRALQDALMRAEADPEIEAIVIAARGKTFVAGGDISEFGRKPLEPHLPDVINRIEESAKPVVVAWHGTALGGGCEIGLAAHRRIMARDARVGLPEVKLGLLPGAGGTQRLPRLVGLPAALDIIATGRMVDAREALAIGLCDLVAGDDLVGEAIALAMSLGGKLQPRLSLRPPPAPDAGAWEAMVARVRAQARGRIAPLKAIDLVAHAAGMPFAQALRIERQTFLELTASEQSKALRHLFFAERDVRRVAGIEGARALPVRAVGIVGAGTMGSGIAMAFLDSGYAVTVIEREEAALRAGAERIESLLQRAAKGGRIDAAGLAERRARLTLATELARLAPCDLVIECVFEDMALKQELLGALESILRPEAILATNTSYLDIEAMADGLARPQRFLGLHFFSPAHVMKLMEIVRTRRVSADALATGLAVARDLGKIAVTTGVCEGFIGNRILARFRAECEFMLEEGAMPAEIDAAMEAFGLAMGPFAVQDLAGLDIAWVRRKRHAATRDPAERDVPIVDRLCERGWFGQKAGRGWYRYAEGKRVRDPDVEALVRDHAASTGRRPVPLPAEAIQARVLAAMVNEGAKLLGEGIAARPLDIDVVLVHGYGFPAWRGGPMHEADSRGLAAVLATARENARRDGRGFEVAPLLEELAASGRNFASLNQREPMSQP
ncbi:MAG: enoyl-CoA hydratase/isomerase family protein [Hyphomicrobiales bacterium]|nr:enoyl-CoA hydratase/isomerase family protein [Hyphomicrobiales bacterium]